MFLLLCSLLYLFLVLYSLFPLSWLVNSSWSQVSEKTALLRPIELKLVPMALESSAFRSKFLDTDELLSYVSWFAVVINFAFCQTIFCSFLSLVSSGDSFLSSDRRLAI